MRLSDFPTGIDATLYASQSDVRAMVLQARREVSMRYDMDPDRDCFLGPAVYTARVLICLDCGALLTESDQRAGYDTCDLCTDGEEWDDESNGERMST